MVRLLTGPAGSGKTFRVLDRLREALRAGEVGARLLVPTATLAQHLQNQLAREGLVIRRTSIQTLYGFIDQWAGDRPQVSETVLALVVEAAARRVGRAEFARVVHMPGFCASLARVIEEFSSAGCGSERLAEHLPEAPFAPAFLAVYREVERELERRGLALRAQRLERAAARIAAEGAGGIRTVWLDGFHALPDPELRVIAALGGYADVTLTLADPDITAAVRALGFQSERLTRPGRPAAARVLVRAPSIEREAEEIARRILEQSAAGRPFREMGVVVRSPEIYVPVLRAVLERFGIPARFYFEARLEEHAAVRYLAGAVDAMLDGWDYAQTLAVLRLAPRFADSAAMDRLDFAVREQIPGSGLGGLKALAGESEGLKRLIDSLGAIEEWRALSLAPGDWAVQLKELRHLFRPGVVRPGGLTYLLRSQAAAVDAFDEALDEAAQALAGGPQMPFEEFWRTVKAVLRLKPLRVEDNRRDVVQVLSAPEARQWVLPVVFICGMVEKQFPQVHRQDPFFPQAARHSLNAAGIRVRTAEEFEREERELFDSALTRASMLAVLSYPEFDARGERNLPSIFLEDLGLDPQPSRNVRLKPRRQMAMRPQPALAHPDLLEWARAKSARLSATALESYLQCPFQYFGRALRLTPPPPRPAERLDFLTQGAIVHETLKEWYTGQPEIGALFEEIFASYAEEKGIALTYQTERLRQAMLEDVRGFVTGDPWPRADFDSRTEQEFSFQLSGGVVEISGRIDRLDTGADGRSYVIDYKYSAAQTTRDKLENDNLVQGPLYLIAAEEKLGAKPAGMYYIGLKGGITYAGWSAGGPAEIPHKPLAENWRAAAEQKALGIVEEIRSGRIEAAPADPEKCRWCDYRDVCRYEARGAAVVAEGA